MLFVCIFMYIDMCLFVCVYIYYNVNRVFYMEILSRFYFFAGNFKKVKLIPDGAAEFTRGRF